MSTVGFVVIKKPSEEFRTGGDVFEEIKEKMVRTDDSRDVEELVKRNDGDVGKDDASADDKTKDHCIDC
ncbi:hypothetical protein PPACK8108_LOCUS12967 [Phakopsora pachyrhizi]|uniref:Uncharacterized protein n=1 Tax=Phakopsora pachyrhizi TaxID=170000 RepID=A0AAV0B3W0_PHAPC|nr:hypothetical protein PPACK8108_LOCUS12967 [Phakopsora pachyrhizi]